MSRVYLATPRRLAVSSLQSMAGGWCRCLVRGDSGEHMPHHLRPHATALWPCPHGGHVSGLAFSRHCRRRTHMCCTCMPLRASPLQLMLSLPASSGALVHSRSSQSSIWARGFFLLPLVSPTSLQQRASHVICHCGCVCCCILQGRASVAARHACQLVGPDWFIPQQCSWYHGC